VVVGTLPGLGTLYAQDGIRTQLVRAFYEVLQKLACRLSDMTVFQNKDDLREFVQRGICPQQRAVVIPGSGIQTTTFDPDKISKKKRFAVREELGLSRTSTVVTMVTRIMHMKGVNEFSQAAQCVSQQMGNVRFLLIGEKERKTGGALTQHEINAIKKNVKWVGPRKDIPAILAASDIFVLASYYREGIPRALLEAAAMGLPLIACDMPGCREVVKNGQNGFLVPARNPEKLAAAIVMLAADKEKCKQYGRYSRTLALEKFSLTKVAQKTASLYTQLLNNR